MGCAGSKKGPLDPGGGAPLPADGDDFGPDSAKENSLEDVSTSPELLAETLVRLHGMESAEAVLKRALEQRENSLEDVSTSPELLAETLVRLRGMESAEAVLKRALEHLGSVCMHHHLGAVSISDECDEHCTCASCLASPTRRPTVNKPRMNKVHVEAKQSGVQDE